MERLECVERVAVALKVADLQFKVSDKSIVCWSYITAFIRVKVSRFAIHNRGLAMCLAFVRLHFMFSCANFL